MPNYFQISHVVFDKQNHLGNFGRGLYDFFFKFRPVVDDMSFLF